MPYFIITYTDGRTERLDMTPRARCKAEEHAQVNGWGSVQDSPQRISYYTAYAASRLKGTTTLPFDQWLDTVADIDFKQPGEVDEENPTD
ncbi:hypothetical protein BLI708_06685 [Bifidobacterium imperatoris]|nr:hypothetical protein BLI708_06685 [Bifidobacterium imperatoris]